ncbi:CPBP family intramembrane glutamic endopeptidase [Streptococcus pseudoporcinus]|uniref:CAAX amino terminal protease family protein n=1 Tax=Streptococcus pseudoporcinus LQ 940-04 TaxID=875093 RepID=G5KA03_9STRE|nr:type II CAAX endopeptidase family protein [Streptococcus pseudoporcinus]EFR43569.1 CAAX amino terminal protease family protein [Streptococcus pseudoporcinus SPIN 20026]EHI65183.1 CAAX amino terminal protease family protein [Streptococcus pseudoporcinus LQ 940-04]VEF93745.1 CAAX amino terminal protease family membrane protein [Streptococcus pseudoporcinus]
MKAFLSKLKWIFLAIAILVVEQAPLLLIRKGQALWQVLVLTLVMLALVIGGWWIAKKLGFFATEKVSDYGPALWVGLGFVALTTIKSLGAMLLFFEHGAKANTTNQAMLENAGLHPLLLFMLAALVAPMIEELIFRGLVYGKTFGRQSWLGLLLSSFLFGLIHMPSDIGSWVIYGGMGIVLGVVYMFTNKLSYTIAIHALNNGIAVVLMLLMSSH